MPPSDAAASQASRRCRRVVSRWTNSSRPTPSIPATSFRNPIRRPSPISRRSAARGSERLPVGRPRRSYLWVSAGGKHSSCSRPGMPLAKGSPSTIAASTQPSGRVRLKASISALVQRDLAASGEQRTIRYCDEASAFRISAPRSSAAASSCRSRKTGVSRFGTTPLAVSLPASADGTRNFSSCECSQSAVSSSLWL